MCVRGAQSSLSHHTRCTAPVLSGPKRKNHSLIQCTLDGFVCVRGSPSPHAECKPPSRGAPVRWNALFRSTSKKNLSQGFDGAPRLATADPNVREYIPTGADVRSLWRLMALGERRAKWWCGLYTLLFGCFSSNLHGHASIDHRFPCESLEHPPAKQGKTAHRRLWAHSGIPIIELDLPPTHASSPCPAPPQLLSR